ncbi:MAG: hypothetical protein IPG04_24570 [Polyangiaceae bacterium]|nr:hypothetical protein [Polyangiaceae bacterium]
MSVSAAQPRALETLASTSSRARRTYTIEVVIADSVATTRIANTVRLSCRLRSAESSHVSSASACSVRSIRSDHAEMSRPSSPSGPESALSWRTLPATRSMHRPMSGFLPSTVSAVTTSRNPVLPACSLHAATARGCELRRRSASAEIWESGAARSTSARGTPTSAATSARPRMNASSRPSGASSSRPAWIRLPSTQLAA